MVCEQRVVQYSCLLTAKKSLLHSLHCRNRSSWALRRSATLERYAVRHFAMNLLLMRTLESPKELGGWKTLGVVIRYTHLSPDHKRAAVERLISVRTGTRTSTEQNAELAAVDNLLKINSFG